MSKRYDQRFESPKSLCDDSPEEHRQEVPPRVGLQSAVRHYLAKLSKSKNNAVCIAAVLFRNLERRVQRKRPSRRNVAQLPQQQRRDL